MDCNHVPFPPSWWQLGLRFTCNGRKVALHTPAMGLVFRAVLAEELAAKLGLTGS
jgi:hypothetical protein